MYFYNLICTRVLGWGCPSALMVPLIDFINFGPNKECRLDFVQRNNQSHYFIKLSSSSSKRKIDTLHGIQTDLSIIFAQDIKEDEAQTEQ